MTFLGSDQKAKAVYKLNIAQDPTVKLAHPVYTDFEPSGTFIRTVVSKHDAHVHDQLNIAQDPTVKSSNFGNSFAQQNSLYADSTPNLIKQFLEEVVPEDDLAGFEHGEVVFMDDLSSANDTDLDEDYKVNLPNKNFKKKWRN